MVAAWVPFAWIAAVLYSFFCQALICEKYFVPALDVVIRRFRIPDDVAGATLMAIGTSSPELFCNLVAIFVTGTLDTGTGTIVGSDLFNMLMICGVAAICAGTLTLDWTVLAREVIFYGISIILLYRTLSDGIVTAAEAWIFVAAYLAYTLCCCAFSSMPCTSSTALPVPDDTAVDVADAQAKAPAPTSYNDKYVDCEAEAISSELGWAWDIRRTDGQGVAGAAAGIRPVPAAFSTFEYSDETFAHTSDGLAQVHEIGSWSDLVSMTCCCCGTCVGSRSGPSAALSEPLRPSRLGQMAARCCRFDVRPLTGFTAKVIRDLCDIPQTVEGRVQWIIAFPANCVFKFTIPDVTKPENERYYWLAILAFLLWLPLLSYVMVVGLNEIAGAWGISQSAIALTVSAAGTSFPDLCASVIVAKEGQGNMAVANAFGSNIFNIFIASGLPWAFYASFCLKAGDDNAAYTASGRLGISTPSKEIQAGVVTLAGALLAFLLLMIQQGFVIKRVTGWLFAISWVGYAASQIVVLGNGDSNSKQDVPSIAEPAPYTPIVYAIS